MINLGKLREAQGYTLVLRNNKTGECTPVQSDYVEVVRCKDCKHKPWRLEEGEGDGFNIEFPDYRCPCRCDDGWYNWMPNDDWHCGNGERKEE